MTRAQKTALAGITLVGLVAAVIGQAGQNYRDRKYPLRVRSGGKAKG